MTTKDHPWVGVDNIIQNEKGQILLIQRSATSKTYPNHWGLIGGWVEWDETLADALIREAKEEIGVDVEIIKPTGKFYDAPGRHPTKTCVCVPHFSKIVKGDPTANQPEEVQKVKWFSPEEIKDLEMAYDHKQMLSDANLI